MVGVGIAGIGFMGRIHALALERVPGARLAAVQSRDPAKRAGDWSATRGNFGPEPGRFDLTGVAAHATFAELLADPAVDLVDICTPTDQHPVQAVAALEAGKHVLIEKPIALTTADADRVLAAAAAAGKLVMVAHVLPFFPEFAFAAEAVASGRFGKLVAAHFTRVIAAPDWSAAVSDAAKTGGPALDLHVHDTHFVGVIAGTPAAVRSSGVEAGEAVTYVATQYDTGPGGPAVTSTCGAVAAKGRPFAHGFEIYLERATLAYHSGGVPLTLFTDAAEVVALPGGGDPLTAFAAELAAAAGAVRTGTVPPALSGKLGRDAVALCQCEIESVRSGQRVMVG